MIRPAKRRLFGIVAALIGTGGALFLIFNSLRDHLVFFFSPTELQEKAVQPHQKIKVGGMVKSGTVARHKGQRVTFTLTDFKTDLFVEYTGILPDLFGEGQGAVAEGFLASPRAFKATTILAKHDETYMPPEVAQTHKKEFFGDR